MAKFDLISVGDTQYDVFLELEEETKILKDPESGMEYLSLVSAEKIPAKSYKAVPAVGNSANVAIGASRLGLKSAFYTHLGKDDVGEEELKIFKKEKVATDYVVWDKERGSNFSAVLNYKGERTIIVHHEHRPYELPKLSPAEWMYFSSLAEGHDKLHTQIPEYVKKHGVKVGFNPGSFQLKEKEGLCNMMEATTVFFVNKEEAQELLGNSKDVKELLKGLKAKGPEIVVITDGPGGSYCHDGKTFWHLEIFRVPVVEMTGAGDSYSSGFIGALAHGKDISEAMRWGAVNAGSVIQKIGAREGLLTKKEIEQFLKEHQEFQAREI